MAVVAFGVMTRPPNTRPPYSRQHTGADPSNVVTETQVPNEAKALPSQKGPAMVLAFGGAAVALLAVILDFYEIDTIAVVLAIVAVLMTIVSVIMAINDVRTGRTTPILCAIVSAVVLVVALMDVLDVDDAIEERQDAIRENTSQRLDPAGDGEIPADPADIVEGEDARDADAPAGGEGAAPADRPDQR